MDNKEIRSIIKKSGDWVYMVDLVKDYGLSIAKIQEALRPKDGKKMLREGYEMSQNCQRVRYVRKDWSYEPSFQVYGIPDGELFYLTAKDAARGYGLPVEVIQLFNPKTLLLDGVKLADMGGYIKAKYPERR